MAAQWSFQIESSLKSQHLTDSKYIQGSYTVVQTVSERDALPVKTATTDGVVVDGSLVYVSEENKSYRYSNGSWIKETVVSEFTSGVATNFDEDHVDLQVNSRWFSINADNELTLSTSATNVWNNLTEHYNVWHSITPPPTATDDKMYVIQNNRWISLDSVAGSGIEIVNNKINAFVDVKYENGLLNFQNSKITL